MSADPVSADPDAHGGTRWRTTLLAALPALLCAGGIGWAVSVGAVASSLQVQNGSLHFSTSSLYGTHFGAALVDQDTSATNPDGSQVQVHVLRLGFADGVINGLCLSQKQTIGGFDYTLMLTLGDSDTGTWEVRTKNTVLDLTSVAGTLDMDGLVELNVNGPDVTTVQDSTGALVSNPLAAPENRFGIQAGYAKFDQVSGQVADIQIPGLLSTPHLAITVRPGDVPCAAPPAPTGTPGTP